MIHKTEDEKLSKAIGVRSLALAIANITIGSGIFILPAIVASGLGAAAILAYGVCGLLIFLIALCFAQLGSNTEASGGPYTYIEGAFGPMAGFLANNVFWLAGCVVSDAALANALADTLAYFFPRLAENIFRVPFLLILFAGLAWLNIRSVKAGLRLVEIATLTKILPLILIVIAAAGSIAWENLRWTIAPTFENIGSASLLLFFAFIGLEAPLSNGGEIRNPWKTVPAGIFLGVSGVLILYVCIQLVTQGVLGAQLTAAGNGPIAAVAGIALGPWALLLIIIITAVCMLGSLSGEILSIPRILFAGARDGLLPRPLARVHSIFKTPFIAIAVYAGLGFIFSVSGGFRQLAIIASAAVLLIYLGVVFASWKLRQGNKTREGFQIPGGPIVPVLASAGIIWLLSNLSGKEVLGMGIFIAVFAAIYLVMKLVQANKKAAII